MSKLQFIITALILIIGAGVLLLLYSTPEYDYSSQTQDKQDITANLEKEMVEANNKFSLDLLSFYHNKYEQDNIFFSPFSISSALAVISEGAKQKTLQEIQEVFNLPQDRSVIRSSFLDLNQNLNQEHENYSLYTSNALWLQEDYNILEEFLSPVKNYYQAKTETLDFKTQPEESRKIINNWVAQETNEKIKYLLPQNSITSLTKLVLTNAIYFKGDWVREFDKDKTKPQEFKINQDKTVEVDMMNMTGRSVKESDLAYTQEEKFKALKLPYKGKEVSMIVLLPKKMEDMEDMISSLSLDKLNNLDKKLQEKTARNKEVEVFLPKFEFKQKYKMKQDLSELGMPTAFSNQANFSGITGKKDLLIDEVYHQAFVSLDEEGTEATGATGVVMRQTTAMPGHKLTFKADHPFVFIIQHDTTREILFIGKVLNPEK